MLGAAWHHDASDRDSDSESDFFIPPGPHWQPASASLLLSEAQAGLTSLALRPGLAA